MSLAYTTTLAALALLAFGSMWACWKLGYEAGEEKILQEFSDYCKRRDCQKISPCRDDRQDD